MDFAKENETIPNRYFELLGKPEPSRPFSLIDDYRFKLVLKYLAPGSVLDIGAYFGDFLKLARNDGREIFGTEVNQERVNTANENLGENVVRIGFRNGSLNNFDDNYVDNIVCTEVMEHVQDNIFAFSELSRVARKRVIVTVPFKETIQQSLCIHCGNYTPLAGHLHSYDLDTFHQIIPEDWMITLQKPFGKIPIIMATRWLNPPRSQALIPFIKVVDFLSIGPCYWLLIVFNNIR